MGCSIIFRCMCVIFRQNTMPFLTNQILLRSCSLSVPSSVAASLLTLIVCKRYNFKVLNLWFHYDRKHILSLNQVYIQEKLLMLCSAVYTSVVPFWQYISQSEVEWVLKKKKKVRVTEAITDCILRVYAIREIYSPCVRNVPWIGASKTLVRLWK